MDKTINLKISYTEEDVIKVSRKVFFQGIKIIPPIIYCFVVVFGFTYWFIRGIAGGIIFLILGIILLVITGFRFFHLPKKKYMKDETMQKQEILTINNEGIISAMEGIEKGRKLQWNEFRKLKEDEHYYYLYFKRKRHFALIPKRVFKDKSEESLFKELVSKNIQRK